MGFKKHNWTSYGRTGDVIEINVKDSSGAKLDFFRCDNGKSYKEVLKIVKDKYGFSPEIDIEDSPNYNKDIDWLKSNEDW